LRFGEQDKPKSFFATPAHTIALHGRLVELGGCHGAHIDAGFCIPRKVTRKPWNTARLHVFALPEHALGLYSFTGFTAGEGVEKHKSTLWVY
jgi:hypothetical protein